MISQLSNSRGIALMKRLCPFMFITSLAAIILSSVAIQSLAQHPDLVWNKGGINDKAALSTVVLSPNGQFLASGDTDHSLKIWRIADTMLLRTFRHSGNVLS